MTLESLARRHWYWLAALLVALAVHLSGLSLVRFDVARAPDQPPNSLVVSLGNTGTAPMPHTQPMPDNLETPAAPRGQATAPAGLPQGNALREAPASPPPAAPAQPAPPRPVAKAPAPKPAQAPLAESVTPAMPKATNPPMRALPDALLPDALVPDRADASQTAKRETRSADPALASLPAHVSARLGAIGGGPVWLNGEPPANAGQVPQGSDFWNLVNKALHEAGRYPPKAAPLGLEGVATVEFVIDRSGRILTYRRLRSAGHIILDHEVNRMMEFARLPPPPASFPDEALLITIHVNFEILKLADQRRAAR